jgi:hypothetical protein
MWWAKLADDERFVIEFNPRVNPREFPAVKGSFI